MFEKFLSLMVLDCDKANHAFYGLLMYSLIGLVSIELALLIVILIALGKEVYDSLSDHHTADEMDMLYTIAAPIVLYFIQFVVQLCK